MSTQDDVEIVEMDPRVRRTQRDVVQAASELLIEGGWFAVTHANVAKRAGYSKATLYNHWPEPADLGRAAFAQVCDAPHHVPTGDLRADLIGELTAFADALVNQHLARVLAALAEQAPADPAMAEVLEQFDTEGSAVALRILRDHGYTESEAQTTHEAIAGALMYRVMMRQLEPTPESIEQIVDHELAAFTPKARVRSTSPSATGRTRRTR